MPRTYGPRGIPLVRRYIRKRTFSTVDRVVIHLSTNALRPEERTQEGIAAAIRSGRSTLTKWLDRLESRGTVTRDRIRLSDHPLPKYAYRLTEPGWRSAAELRQRLGSQVVTVHVPRVGDLSARLSEVPRLASARLDLTAALACVRKGRLDLAGAANPERGRGPPIWGGGLRRADRFFGRQEELHDLDGWWASDSRALLVTGLPGIGKSALVAAWAQDRRLDVPVYGFEIRRSSTAAGLLSDVGSFLATLGKPSLAAHLAQGVPLDTRFVARLLARELQGKEVLVVLDNADQAAKRFAKLVRDLFLEDAPPLPIRLILLGRRHPSWLARDARLFSLQTCQIQGLEPEAARALLRARGLAPNAPSTEDIIRRTRGHPLLLHLAASAGAGQASAAHQYLREEIWDSLSARDRSTLEAAAIFRTAVSERVLEMVSGTGHLTVEGLVERNLLERTVAGSLVMHDVIRGFVDRRLSEIRRRRLHTRAASVLVEARDSRETWEGVYHLLAAGRASEAATLLDSDTAPLLDCLGAEEIAALVRNVTLDESEARTYCVFAEVLGDSLRTRGHVGPALFQYRHAQRLAESARQEQRIPRLLRKIAFLERCRNHYPRALGLLTEAQARLHNRPNPEEMIEVLREMALAEQALGNLSAAEQHLNRAVDLATDSSDSAALSRALLALGSLEAQRGHEAQGLESSLEGLRVAERSGSLTETAHAQIVVGALLTGVGRNAESVRHHTVGFETARLLGNLRLMAYATMNRANSLLALGRLAEAGASLREATGYFEILEEKDTLGFVKTYEGELEMKQGHWSRATAAWEEGVEELRVHGSPTDLALVLREVATFYLQHGDAEASRHRLQEARDVASRLGNAELVSKIDADLRILRPTPAGGIGG